MRTSTYHIFGGGHWSTKNYLEKVSYENPSFPTFTAYPNVNAEILDLDGSASQTGVPNTRMIPTSKDGSVNAISVDKKHCKLSTSEAGLPVNRVYYCNETPSPLSLFLGCPTCKNLLNMTVTIDEDSSRSHIYSPVRSGEYQVNIESGLHYQAKFQTPSVIQLPCFTVDMRNGNPADTYYFAFNNVKLGGNLKFKPLKTKLDFDSSRDTWASFYDEKSYKLYIKYHNVPLKAPSMFANIATEPLTFQVC